VGKHEVPEPINDGRWRPDTVAVRAGLTRTGFEETAEGLFLTSGYVYGSAAEAEASFAGEIDHFVYSRFGNPTVAMFEERFRRMEGAEAAWATASGMAAVFNALAATLQAGDRVVAARGLFGSCFVILDELLPRWGIHTEFVDGPDLEQWEAALREPAAAVFFESPSNPMQDLVDIAAVSDLAHRAGAVVIVDNVFATPVLQRPIDLGADVVVYSTTKHIDGHGRTLGGIICGSTEFISERLQPLMRHTGPTLSPFTAWVLVKSLESLALRVRHQTASALRVAEHLDGDDRAIVVRYPWLASHPQADLARRQMLGGGTVVTFEIDGGRDEAFAVLDRLQIIDISNNLGDAKSLVTHPATTTHRRLGPEVRKLMGIGDGVIRVSVGLEDVDDLLGDIDQALEAL
jgi:O-succinylhomoserine sulfhydrylase